MPCLEQHTILAIIVLCWWHLLCALGPVMEPSRLRLSCHLRLGLSVAMCFNCTPCVGDLKHSIQILDVCVSTVGCHWSVFFFGNHSVFHLTSLCIVHSVKQRLQSNSNQINAQHSPVQTQAQCRPWVVSSHRRSLLHSALYAMCSSAVCRKLLPVPLGHAQQCSLQQYVFEV